MGSYTFHRILRINLVFLVSPDISTEETSSDTIVKEGQDAILTCKATGRPMPQITWRKEDGQSFVVKEGKSKRKGKEFETSNSTNIEMNKIYQDISRIYFNIFKYNVLFSVSIYRGEVLQLHRVRRKDMGAFMCIASNDVPPTVSRRVSLSVNCKYTFI